MVTVSWSCKYLQIKGVKSIHRMRLDERSFYFILHFALLIFYILIHFPSDYLVAPNYIPSI